MFSLDVPSSKSLIWTACICYEVFTREKTLMTYRAIIFDLDGTLLNTLEDIGDATNHVLSERGFPVHDMDAYRSFIGDGAGVLIKRALPPGARDKETIRSCLDAFLKYYGEHWDVKTRPYDGIRDMLSALTAPSFAMLIAMMTVTPMTTPNIVSVVRDGRATRFFTAMRTVRISLWSSQDRTASPGRGGDVGGPRLQKGPR